MSKGELLIRPHQYMSCPSCHVHAEFHEALYREEVPFLICCPKCNYKYEVNEESVRFFHLPKRDPRMSISQVWRIEFPQENPLGEPEEEKAGGDDTHSKIMNLVGKLPPQLRTRSVKERIDELASMMIVCKSVHYSIVDDFRTAMSAFMDEVNSAISPYVYLRGAFDANAAVEFFEQPFLIIPLTFVDDHLRRFSKLIASPRFYRRIHGIPIGNGGGFMVQLVCPYSFLDEPPPDFLRKLLGIPETPSLEMLERKIVGKHLAYCWKDIPGTEPDVDHSNNNPSIRIAGDGSLARQYLVQYGIQPWRDLLDRHDLFYQTRLEWVKKNFTDLHECLRRLAYHGRVMFVHRKREKRLRMMGAAIQSFEPQTILIHGTGERISWPDLGVISGTQINKSPVVMMDYQEFIRGDYYEQAEMIIAEADQPYSEELLPYLYRFNGRLLLLSGDPLFDTLEGNEYAKVVYGLVNRVWYDRENFLMPRVWRQDDGVLAEKLATALRRTGFID